MAVAGSVKDGLLGRMGWSGRTGWTGAAFFLPFLPVPPSLPVA
jgi:hypothetical protein